MNWINTPSCFHLAIQHWNSICKPSMYTFTTLQPPKATHPSGNPNMLPHSPPLLNISTITSTRTRPKTPPLPPPHPTPHKTNPPNHPTRQIHPNRPEHLLLPLPSIMSMMLRKKQPPKDPKTNQPQHPNNPLPHQNRQQQPRPSHKRRARAQREHESHVHQRSQRSYGAGDNGVQPACVHRLVSML